MKDAIASGKHSWIAYAGSNVSFNFLKLFELILIDARLLQHNYVYMQLISNLFVLTNFKIMQTQVSSNVEFSGYDPAVDGQSRGESGTLNDIYMYGVQSNPSSANINGQNVAFKYDSTDKVTLNF